MFDVTRDGQRALVAGAEMTNEDGAFPLNHAVILDRNSRTTHERNCGIYRWKVAV
jgi:hypothetical protein